MKIKFIALLIFGIVVFTAGILGSTTSAAATADSSDTKMLPSYVLSEFGLLGDAANKSRITCMTFAQDGNPLLAAGYEDGTLHVWNIASGKLVKDVQAESAVKELVFANRNRLTVLTRNNDVQIYDTDTQNGNPKKVTNPESVRWANLVTGTSSTMFIFDSNNKLWSGDVMNKAISTIPTSSIRITISQLLSFSTNTMGTKGIAVGSDGSYHSFEHDARIGKLTSRESGIDGAITSAKLVKFNSDLTAVAVASGGSSLAIYEYPGFANIFNYNNNRKPVSHLMWTRLTMQDKNLSSLIAISDGEMIVYDVNTGNRAQLPFPWAGCKQPSAVAIAPGGDLAAVATDDKIHLLNILTPVLVNHSRRGAEESVADYRRRLDALSIRYKTPVKIIDYNAKSKAHLVKVFDRTLTVYDTEKKLQNPRDILSAVTAEGNIKPIDMHWFQAFNNKLFSGESTSLYDFVLAADAAEKAEAMRCDREIHGEEDGSELLENRAIKLVECLKTLKSSLDLERKKKSYDNSEILDGIWRLERKLRRVGGELCTHVGNNKKANLEMSGTRQSTRFDNYKVALNRIENNIVLTHCDTWQAWDEFDGFSAKFHVGYEYASIDKAFRKGFPRIGLALYSRLAESKHVDNDNSWYGWDWSPGFHTGLTAQITSSAEQNTSIMNDGSATSSSAIISSSSSTTSDDQAGKTSLEFEVPFFIPLFSSPNIQIGHKDKLWNYFGMLAAVGGRKTDNDARFDSRFYYGLRIAANPEFFADLLFGTTESLVTKRVEIRGQIPVHKFENDSRLYLGAIVNAAQRGERRKHDLAHKQEADVVRLFISWNVDFMSLLK